MSATRKVLVIDSDLDACGLIAKALEPKGIEVISFADPDEGVARAGEIRPDLVFISILFPGSNGLKISKAVHSVEGLQGVPVIMLISYSDELDPRYTSTIGIVDVALKPLDAREILSKTAAVLGEGFAPEDACEAGGDVPVMEEAEAASLDDEWMSFLEKGDRETVEPVVESQPIGDPTRDSYGAVSYKTEAGDGRGTENGAGHEGETQESDDDAVDGPAEKVHGSVDVASQDETTDFLLAEEEKRTVREDEKEGPESPFPAEKRSMKKFVVVVSAVIVIAALAGAGVYLLFQGHRGTIVSPAAKTQMKKAPVAEARRNAAPAEKPVMAAKATPAETAGTTQSPPSEKPAVAAKAPSVEPAAKTTQLPPAETAAKALPSAPKKKAGNETAKGTEKAEKEVYSVQVGAFNDSKNAAMLIDKLKRKGYDAFGMNDAGRRLHRVLIGRFGSREVAALEAKRVSTREGLTSIVYRY